MFWDTIDAVDEIDADERFRDETRARAHLCPPSFLDPTNKIRDKRIINQLD